MSKLLPSLSLELVDTIVKVFCLEGDIPTFESTFYFSKSVGFSSFWLGDDASAAEKFSD